MFIYSYKSYYLYLFVASTSSPISYWKFEGGSFWYILSDPLDVTSDLHLGGLEWSRIESPRYVICTYMNAGFS